MGFEAGAITGRIDLNTTSFHEGMNEVHTHAESAGGEIRESFEAIAESLTEAVGPALGQIGNQLQSVFAGFSEGAILGSLNAVAVGAGAVRETLMSVGEEFASVNKQAEISDVSVEFLSKLGAEANTVGVDLQTLTNSMFMLNRQAEAAVDGDKKVAEAFGHLGISTADLNQHMGDTQWIVDAVIDGLQKLANAQERARYGQEILSRGARELTPLMRMTADEMQAAAKRAEDMGATMTDANAETGKSFERLKADVDFFGIGVENAFDTEILKDFNGDLGKIEDHLKGISKYIIDTLIPDLSKIVIPDVKIAGGAALDAGKTLLGAGKDTGIFDMFPGGNPFINMPAIHAVQWAIDKSGLGDFIENSAVNRSIKEIGFDPYMGNDPLNNQHLADLLPHYTGQVMSYPSLNASTETPLFADVARSIEQLVMTMQDSIRKSQQTITHDNAAATNTPPGSASHSGPTTQPITVEVHTHFDPHAASTELSKKTLPVMKKVHHELKQKMQSDYQKYMTEQSMAQWGMD